MHLDILIENLFKHNSDIEDRRFAMSEMTMKVPQMLGLEALTRIIVAYLKAGADDRDVDYESVSQIADIAAHNIGRNATFYQYIGLLEGGRGKFRLTDLGKSYAQALNWGRISDAANLLRKGIHDNELVSRILGYVDLNAPVPKDDLVSRIALIADVRNVSRYKTGINGFIDMLVSVELLKENENGNIVLAKISPTDVELEPKSVEFKEEFESKQPKMEVPINITLNIDVKELDPDNLKKMIKAIREALMEEE